VRSLALLGAASAAIHQLRYAIGYGNDASAALAAHPHGYLAAAMPGIVTALAIVIAAVLMRAAGARPRIGNTGVRSFAALWIACAIALALTYALQETLEGAGAFAGSGWIGLALAIPAGFVVALALRGADAAESLRLRDALLRVVSTSSTPLRVAHSPLRTRFVALRLSARGPPASFVV
jgi:hypothetical protein